MRSCGVIGKPRSRSACIAFARLLAGIAAVSLWAAPLCAGDGVIEINQVRALAGGLSPADEPGFPVTVSAGSYRLTTNLILRELEGAPDLTAIDAGSDTVTIDLNGFSIIGPVECSGSPRVCTSTGAGVGVRLGNQSALMNGTVRGMGDAGVVGGADSLVRDVRAIGNGGAGVSVGRFSAVIRTKASFNASDGIEVNGDGVLVQSCEARGNGGHGIEVGAGHDAALLRRSVLSSNGLDGIVADRGLATAALSNTIQGNAGRGLTLTGGVGYGSNVISGNLGGEVSNGHELAPNVCDGDLVCAP